MSVIIKIGFIFFAFASYITRPSHPVQIYVLLIRSSTPMLSTEGGAIVKD